MKYIGTPMGMWVLFAGSFQKQLTAVFGYDADAAQAITKKAKPMKWFCRKSGKSKFTKKDIAGMKATAALRAADRNPYSWNMEFYEYPDGSGYEGRFTKCGICVLMQKLGLYDLTPALCRLDYTMSEAGGATDFVRQYTLASGGSYCDCGYKKKGFVKAGTESGR